MKRKEFFSQFAPNKTMLQLMRSWKTNSTKTVTYDELFLADEIWQRASNSSFIHDAYFCHTKFKEYGAVGFPSPRL